MNKQRNMPNMAYSTGKPYGYNIAMVDAYGHVVHEGDEVFLLQSSIKHARYIVVEVYSQSCDLYLKGLYYMAAYVGIHTKPPITSLRVGLAGKGEDEHALFLEAFIAMEGITPEQRACFHQHFREGMARLTSDYRVRRLNIYRCLYLEPERRLKLRMSVDFIAKTETRWSTKYEGVDICTEFAALAYAVVLPILQGMLASSASVSE